MIEIVPPHIANTGKRIIKSPKVYLSDSGILSALLGLKDFTQLAGHPVLGSLWEGIVLANLKGHFPGTDIRFYRTNHGSEIDFLVILPEGIIAIECKASRAPVLSKGTFSAINDLNPKFTFIVSPVDKGYSARKDIDVVSLDELINRIKQML
jgi:predicted AAA+ superfamily ATPase